MTLPPGICGSSKHYSSYLKRRWSGSTRLAASRMLNKWRHRIIDFSFCKRSSAAASVSSLLQKVNLT
jgi:hypothetical protein